MPARPSTPRNRQSEVFFAAVETTRMPMIVTDPHQPDNPIIFANQAFLAMTGYGGGDRRPQLPLPAGPGDRSRHRRGDPRGIADRTELATEILNYRKDGSSFWNALFVSPVHDNAGGLLYFFGSQLDVSRRRDAEEALRQAQKMEALGQLTGGIAHDFNNLLQVVLGYQELLLQRPRPRPDRHRRQKRGLDNAQAAAERAAHPDPAAAGLRPQAAAGRPGAQPEPGGARHARHGSAARWARRSSCGWTSAEDLWNCRVDPSQCEVALLNVLINARDAMPAGGRQVTVETANVVVEPADVAKFAGLPPGRYAMIAVGDTGAGMPAEVQARVLEPFFTTKEEGKGTGLGLSMVYGFARQSGGAVRIDSEEGRRAPRCACTSRPMPARAARRWRRRRGADGPAGQRMRAGGGRPAGCRRRHPGLPRGFRLPRAARRNGREALAVLDGGGLVHLLLSDLIMPGGMNGVVLAREAQRRRPRLKVLLMTGYAEASIERADVGGSEFEIINKPYRRMELGRRVRQVLDGPTGIG